MDLPAALASAGLPSGTPATLATMDRTGQVPAGAEARISRVVKDGRIEAWVGDDKIMRRV